MFNKAKNASPENKATTLVTSDTRSSSPDSPTSSARSSLSIIGSNTQVEGDINSDEDLTVEGHVSGIITCKQNTVTLGTSGYIQGDVFAHTLHVSGKVKGNLVVLQRATIHKGAQVSGTIVAPCLVLEDGSVFHGNIDMNPDNDMLKSAFSEASDSATKPSALGSTADTSGQKGAVEKSSPTKHDETEAYTSD